MYIEKSSPVGGYNHTTQSSANVTNRTPAGSALRWKDAHVLFQSFSPTQVTTIRTSFRIDSYILMKYELPGFGFYIRGML